MRDSVVQATTYPILIDMDRVFEEWPLLTFNMGSIDPEPIPDYVLWSSLVDVLIIDTNGTYLSVQEVPIGAESNT